MNLAKNLETSALFFPDRPAISEDSSEITYAQLNELANRVATSLMEMGLEPGDHVGLCAPNSVGWLAFYFGVLKAGGTVVSLSSQLNKEDLEILLNHCRPKILYISNDNLDDPAGFNGPGAPEKIFGPRSPLDIKDLFEMGSASFRAVDRDRCDTAVILYTGGTTGVPKGVMLTHENINAAVQNIVFHERANERDRSLLFLPYHHIFGQMHIMHAAILSGGCLETIPAFDVQRCLELMAAGRVTKFFAVPSMYVEFLAEKSLKERLGDVRYCFSAAASMAKEVVREWKERTGLSIHESYGMTEAAPMVTYNHLHRHVIGSVGTAVPGVEVQIRDPNGRPLEQGERGEICIRGRNIMKGYFNNPEANKAAFWNGEWFRSGDVGLFDENDYLYIVDRIKDMIVTDGKSVYPREVEEALYSRPEVAECAVIGQPDPKFGERVVAFLVPRPGRTIDEKELKDYLSPRLAPHKIPIEFHTVEDIPKSSAGKMLKRKLVRNPG